MIHPASHLGAAFRIVTLVVPPTLYAVGTFTFVRLAESSIEDLGNARAINRIRGYYRELAVEDAWYFALGGRDAAGVVANRGLSPALPLAAAAPRPSPPAGAGALPLSLPGTQ